MVAAPYWDLSFPAILKVYLERICVSGVTFHYVGDQAEGLWPAEKAVYVSTAGGYVGERHLGEEYVRTLFQQMFGIPAFTTVRCEGWTSGAAIRRRCWRRRRYESTFLSVCEAVAKNKKVCHRFMPLLLAGKMVAMIEREMEREFQKVVQ